MSHILCNDALKKLQKFSLNDILADSLINDKPYNLALIFPTGKFVRYFKQNYIKEYFLKHKKPLTVLKVFTLQGFIQFVFNSLNFSKNYILLSDGYRLALFEEAVAKSNLKFYKSKSTKMSNSILMKLFSLIHGLREDGITLEKLKDDYVSITGSLPEELSYFTDTHRLSDVIKIYEKYDKALLDKYIDFPMLLNLTNGKLNEMNDSEFQLHISNLIGSDTKIYIEGFTDFKKPEISFLSFFNKSTNPFGIHIDYALSPTKQNSNGPLFGNLEEIIINFNIQGFHLISLNDYPNDKIQSEEEILDNKNETAKEEAFADISGFLRRWLFNTEKDFKNPNLSKFIKIFVAENRKEEIRCIAKLVKYLLSIKGYAPRDICICSRQPELYSSLFREIFLRYGIPTNITDRFNLSQSPVVNAVLSILNVINDGFKIDDVSKALYSPYLLFDNYNSFDYIDRFNLIDVARQLRIRGGYLRARENDWIIKFERSIDILKTSLNNLKQKLDDDLEFKRLSFKLEKIQKAYEDFKSITNLLRFKIKKISVLDFQKIIIEIIRNFKVIQVIEKNYLSILNDNTVDEFWKKALLEQSENDSRAINQFLKIVEELTFVINDLMPNLSTSIDFFIDKLKTAITNTKYQISEKQGFGVTITSIEQTRGIPFKVMILCGAIDGEFLLKYTPNQFLGIELPDSEKRHVHSERMLFYQFLTNSPEFFDSNEKLIYISYFKSDNSGEKVRSSFIDALLKISTLYEDGCLIDLSASKQQDLRLFDLSKFEDSVTEWSTSISNIDELYYLISKSNSTKIDIQLSTEQILNIGYIRNYLQKPLAQTQAEETLASITDQNQTLRKTQPDKIFSITELETYSVCPFKYFVKYLLSIEEPLIVDYALPPIEIGSLLHRVLQRFYNEIQTTQKLTPEEEKKFQKITEFLIGIGADVKPVMLHPSQKDYYLSLLVKFTNEELQKIKFDHPFYDLDRESILGFNNNPGYLQIWLHAEIEKQSNNWVFLPALFELSFGLNTNDSLSFGPIMIDNNFWLKGKIDRIEFAEINNNLFFLIADYKSKLDSNLSLKKILNGMSFQMPLYLIAAQNIFQKKMTEINPSGTVYYNLKPKPKNGKLEFYKCLMITTSNPIRILLGKSTGQYLKSDDELYEVLKVSIDHSKNIVENISLLRFPVHPSNLNECEHCKYISACRIKEKKLIFEDNSSDTL